MLGWERRSIGEKRIARMAQPSALSIDMGKGVGVGNDAKPERKIGSAQPWDPFQATHQTIKDQIDWSA